MSQWKRRLRRLMKPPRQLSFTTAGKYFVGLTIGIGFGAINTGNNLLFLLLGMMLSLIIASGILSEAVIRNLSARRGPPRRIFAGGDAPAHFELKNPNRWTSLSVDVSEQNPTCRVGPIAGTTLGPERVPWWKFWRKSNEVSSELDRPVATAYCLRAESGETVELETRYQLPRRGVYEMPGLDVSTRFPFGLFEKVRELDEPGELVVFPSPAPADDWVTTVHARFGDVPENKRGIGEDYYGLRDYRPGEDRRMIHWKSSARRGELVVKETEREEQRAVDLYVLNATGRPAHQRHLVEPDFEAGLRRVCGLIQELVSRGFRVGLHTLEQDVPADTHANQVDQMLDTLARLELHDDRRSFQTTGDSRQRVGRILLGLSGAVDRHAGQFDLVLSFDDADSVTPARSLEEDAVA